MSELRKAGDFPNKSLVEYATVKVEIPHIFVLPLPLLRTIE